MSDLKGSKPGQEDEGEAPRAAFPHRQAPTLGQHRVTTGSPLRRRSGLSLLLALAILAACSVDAPEGGAGGAGDPTTRQTAEARTTPSPAPLVASTPPAATVAYDGVTFTCESAGNLRSECSAGQRVLFCEGRNPTPDSCSPLWYRSELSAVRLVDYWGATFACERFGNRCREYSGGPPPIGFFSPDLWCQGTECTEYDPDEWFSVAYQGREAYLCAGTAFGSRYDCIEWWGGATPEYFAPDLYCSGLKTRPDCSELWYPVDLAAYELIQYSGSTYLCSRPTRPGSSYGDVDCGLYTGGNPNYVISRHLYCSPRASGFECNHEFYPSELDTYELATIGGVQHVCVRTGLGLGCYRYFGGSPSSSVLGLPDYYCNARGCDTRGYP